MCLLAYTSEKKMVIVLLVSLKMRWIYTIALCVLLMIQDESGE